MSEPVALRTLPMALRGKDVLVLAEHGYSSYALDLSTLPEKVTYPELFAPVFFKEQAKRLHVHDLIRVYGGSDDLDVTLVVVSIGIGGVIVRDRSTGIFPAVKKNPGVAK